MSALDQQIGGDHYKELAIQPVEYIHANSIPFIEGCIIKYATRWRDKGGLQDLQKIIHFTHMLIDLEFKPDKLPDSFGCHNMIDPEDVDIASEIEDDSPRMQAIGQNGEMASEVYAAVDQNAWANCELESLTSESRKFANEDENGVFWSEHGPAFNMKRWRVRRWFK